MKYQSLYANGRWFRFTGRRLQVAESDTFIDVMTLRSGEAKSIHQALARFSDKVKEEGFASITSYLTHHILDH